MATAQTVKDSSYQQEIALVMKKRFYIAWVLGIAVLCLCQCSRVPFCFNVPQDFWNDYFPYQEGQTVTFQNEYGETKTFVVENVYVNFGIYEPFATDADPNLHCRSGASVKLVDGDDAIRIYFSMLSKSYEKEKYFFDYTVSFYHLQDVISGLLEKYNVQDFTNIQYGKVQSLYNLYGVTVEFEKEDYSGGFPDHVCPDNLSDVKCERGRGLLQFHDKDKGCTWRLVE